MIPTRIILHHSLTKDSQTVSWSAIRRYHVQNLNWSAIGYHFGIELVGNVHEILTGRMMNRKGAHAYGHNSGSLGVCFVGNFDLVEPSGSTLVVGKLLIKSLMEVLSISKENVVGHCEVSAKSCPGKLFPLQAFKDSL